jgi:hypothetical protein
MRCDPLLRFDLLLDWFFVGIFMLLKLLAALLLADATPAV